MSDPSRNPTVPISRCWERLRGAPERPGSRCSTERSTVDMPGCSLLAGSFPASRDWAHFGCTTSLTSRVSARTPASCRMCSYLPSIWLLLPPTYLVTARIWRLYPLHFAHAIKKAERNLSVTTVPLVELASEGARKPLVLLVQPAQRRIIHDFSICCLNRGRAARSGCAAR